MNRCPADFQSSRNAPCPTTKRASAHTGSLTEKVRLLQTLLDAIPSPVFYKNPDGVYIACNKAFAETVLGLPGEKIIGHTLFDLSQKIPGDLAAVYHSADQELLKTPGLQSYEAQVKCADGFRRTFLFHKKTYTDENGNVSGIGGVMLDLSDQKRALAALQENEAALSQIVMGNSIPTFVIDAEHVITHWNKACENLTGRPASEVIGTRWHWSAFYPEERPLLADMIVDRAAPEAISNFYKGHSRPSVLINGAYEADGFFPDIGKAGRWLFFTAAPLTDADGQITGAIETLQDFTDYRSAQERLHESERRYRLVTDQAADGVCVIQNNHFVFLNMTFVKMFGYEAPVELSKTPIANLIESNHRPAFEKLIQDFRDGSIQEKEVQALCIRQDGTPFWVESHNSFIKWEGEPAVLATVRDITERKTREMAIQEEAHNLKTENIRLKSTIKDRYGLGRLIGKSGAMQVIYDHILKAAASVSNVVVYGESGTGKELVARTIHDLSDRGNRDLIAVNCGAIPESLFESEFFGHKKGAFTGAVMDKSGYLESADGSTLFLDEVGEMPLNIQVKLLRAVENKGFVPLGSTRFVPIDIRIIAATNRDLKEMIMEGKMREDFFYRIHVLPLQVPPLRDRMEDLPLLICHFLNTLDRSAEEDVTVLPEHVIKTMTRYHWPGNVRELLNAIHRYHTFKSLDFLDICRDPEPAGETETAFHRNMTLREAMAQYEKQLIINTLARHQDNRTRTAAELGIERRSLQRKLKKFGITPVR
ncbi:MAG: sigma 54-interacting transcriptional regulator [Thermodesulfobacteriota bacterium]|nr:sigma 54-interacting transcriptional regulator [Thermodesulfobacteriota bacterium]